MIANEGAPALTGIPAWIAGIQMLLDRRGETRRPSLTLRSLAIRSSPQVGLLRAISRMSSRRLLGNVGRPRRRGLHCQKVRNAVRCHLMTVSGLTITSAPHQSKHWDSTIIAIRVVRDAWRGFTLRSLKKRAASREKVSVISAARFWTES